MEHGKFCWNELNTRNPEREKKFYADTLGWSYEGMPMDEGTYWLIKMDGEDVGGMRALIPKLSCQRCCPNPPLAKLVALQPEPASPMALSRRR